MIISQAHSLGIKNGKTNILKTGTLQTTATTADQVILTYTVTTNKTLYLQYITIDVISDAISALAAKLGTWSVETPSGTKIITLPETNPTTSGNEPFVLALTEPIPIASGVVIRVVCTPAAVTAMDWYANLGGYEV